MHRLHDARGANASPVHEAMRHHSRPFNRQHREDAAPVTRHCTLYRALHPLRGTAPDQNGCNAYGSGALHTQTRTNAESAGTSNNTQHNTNDTTPGAAPVTRRYTRYEALHPLRGTAPDQNGCNAYGSGALHAQTRTNAESESPHHTRHRRTGEKSPPTPGAPSTTRNNRTQARTLTHLVATWAHPCACEPTWWQHRHTRPASGKWG